MIIPCPNCKPHTFQDQTHGKNQRVHNPCAGTSSKTQSARCTVCLDVKKDIIHTPAKK